MFGIFRKKPKGKKSRTWKPRKKFHVVRAKNKKRNAPYRKFWPAL